MTLVRLRWAGTSGQDVHLLPGLTSPEFNALVFAVDRDPVSGNVTEKLLKDRPDLSVKFAVQINGTLASHGLEMLDDKTGAITVLSTVPAATTGHSFLVTATATQGTVQATTRIRVYVHGALHNLWLTPFPLTVRFRARSVRLSVLAEFTDGVIGDISPAGRPLDRFEAFQETRRRKERDEPSPSGSGQPDGTVAYRLGTTVPDYWIPLLPVQQGTSIRLQRGILPNIGIGGLEGMLEPQGRVLEPGHDLLLHDEEVPREGARVTRSYQYARWIDGSTHLWIGRRKQPGRGEGSSGLQFDILTELAEG